MSVLIVGCGVIGLSTALELAENGYLVTAMDAYPVPSPWSAANDYNKIIRTEYEDMMYTKMSVEALKMWRSDPKFQDTYNECGRVMMTPKTHVARQEYERMGFDNLKMIGEGMKVEVFRGGQELAHRFPLLSKNSVAEGDELKWNPEGGLAHAANSLKKVYEAAVKAGVKFIFGDLGNATRIKVVDGKDYVVAKDGSEYTADKIIISMGASSGYLVDLKEQQSATGLFVTHIKLSDSEHEFYKNLPVVFDLDMGYFFPPDPKTKILKVCLPGSGASHYVADPFKPGLKKSLPRYKLQNPQDTIPQDGPAQARALLQKYVPSLANHRLFDHKACWIADTSDSHLIVDAVPGHLQLYVSTGDSGHAFKFLPNIGKYVRAKLEKTLDKEIEYCWRWKENATRFSAADCSWRVVDKELDFADIEFADESRVQKL